MAKRKVDAYKDANYLLLVEVVEKARMKFRTEGDWIEELVRRIIENCLIPCKECNGTEFSRNWGEREGNCLSCKLEISFTAGHPIFDGIQLPEAYVLKILAMEAGLAFSSRQFEKATAICYNTCWNIGRKFDLVLAHFFENNAGDLAVPSSCFKAVFTRRSTFTPAGKAPVEEQAAMEEALQDAENAEAAEAENKKSGESTVLDGLSEVEAQVYAALSNLPLAFDQLLESLNISISALSSALTKLALKDLIISLAGDRYVRAAQPIRTRTKIFIALTEHAQLLVNKATSFIRTIYQGVSRKNFQLYLADFWRMQWHEAGLPPINFMKICFDSATISDRRIKAFNTPLVVKLYASSTG